MVDKTAIIYDIIFETQAAGKDIATLNAQMKTLADTNQRLMKLTGGAANSVKQATSSYGRFGSGVQNASFQVADFVTQVNGGVSASRALAQQLPQLLGGLGVFGALAGAAAAIVLPLLGGKSAVEKLSDATKALSDAQDANKKSIADLTAQYGEHAGIIKDIATLREQLAKASVAEALRTDAAAFNAMNESAVNGYNILEQWKNQWANYDFGKTAIGQLIEPIDEAGKKIEYLQNKFGLTEEAAKSLNVPLNQFFTAVENLNTDGAAAALAQINDWMIQNKDQASQLIPFLDLLKTKFDALATIKMPTVDSMGFSFTPEIVMPDFKNNGGENAVILQLKKIEEQEKANKKASDEYAAAAKKSASEFSSFINETQRGVTPLQKLEERLASAKREFERFNAQMTPAQREAAQAYFVDLQKKISDLKFKEKFDEMKAGIDAAKESVSPLITSLMDIQNAVTNDFASGITDAFMAFATGAASAKEAFTQFAADFLKKIAQMIIQSLVLYAIQSALGMTGVAPSQGGGGLLGGIGGLFGRSGIGPREGSGAATPAAFGATASAPSMQAGRILPSAAAAGGSRNNKPVMNVSITNNVSSANVSTRQNQNGDLEIMVEEIMASKISRGGNRIDTAMRSAFGVRRSGK